MSVALNTNEPVVSSAKVTSLTAAITGASFTLITLKVKLVVSASALSETITVILAVPV